MKSFSKVLSNLNFFLVVLLLFLYAVQDKMLLPPLLQSIGRMHPLMLHFPIVLTCLLLVVWFSKSLLGLPSFGKIFLPLFQWTVCLSLISALLGLFLSREGGYDDDLMTKHKYLTIAYSVSLYGILGLVQWNANYKFITASMIVVLGLMILGTHFGSELTHGKGFVLQPLQKEKADQDSLINKTLFAAAIQPIFQAKCYSCHNEHKLKGGLDMTSLPKLIAGGDDGAIWKAGDAGKSLMIQNIHLPADDKKHMPPNGKTQLTGEEVSLLTLWINAGANTDSLLKTFLPADTLYKLAMNKIQSNKAEIKKYTFPPASAKLVSSLNDPFCTISSIAQNAPALRVDFYVREKYNPQKLQDFQKIKDQIVILNMDNMPVKDDNLVLISKFSNLEELNLNNSAVTAKGLEELKKLKFLKLLSLAGTRLDPLAITVLKSNLTLKQVFLWNTGITDTTLLRNGTIEFNMGYVPNANEILTLTPPTFVNENAILDTNESLTIKHQIPGVTIRFTLNDSTPDSTSSPVYQKPIGISGYTIVKAKGVKEGWLSSPVAEFMAFKKGWQPVQSKLYTRPNEKYNGDGIILIDNKKGNIGNFLEGGWLGFREQPMDALFYFEQAPTLHRISVSYDKSVNAYLFPPTEAILLAGNDSSRLSLIKKISLRPLTKADLGKVRNEILDIDFKPAHYRYYRLKLQNVTKLPVWHPGKGKIAWLFVDEVFFY